MTETLSDKQNLKLQGEVKTHFEKTLSRPLTEAEVLECLQSLFYLGRAIYKFNLLKQGVKNELST